MARYMRSDLGRGHSTLRKPVVVGAGISFGGPGILFTRDARSSASKVRFSVQSKLSPPAVIGEEEVVENVAYDGPGTLLTRDVRSSAANVRLYVGSKLRQPVVVATPALTTRLNINLTPQDAWRRRRSTPPHTVFPGLRPAIIPPLARPTAVNLTPSRRGIAKPLLAPPAHIQVEPNRPLAIHLTYSRRGAPKSDFVVPAVVGDGIFYRPVLVHLTYSRRGNPQYFLSPPIIPPLARPVVVNLAPSTRGVAKAFLTPPTVVQVEPNRPTQVHLTYSRRGKPRSTYVRAPAIEETPAVEIYGPGTTLVRIRPPKVAFDLANPAVIRDIPGALGRLALTLVRIRPRPTTHVLRPAVVVSEVAAVYYGPSVQLAPSHRGKTQSKLSPPRIVFLAVEVFGPEVTLTPSRRPVTKSQLQPPVVVFPFFARETSITLVRIRPPLANARLFPPTDVLDAQELALGPEIYLTYSRRGIAKSALKPPAVVSPVLFFGPVAELAPSLRGKPKSFLRPPTVVAQPPAYQRVVPPTLTYSRRGRPIYFLGPPTVVFPFSARKTDITLAPQRRGEPRSFLRPPAILRTAGQLQVNLTYSRRGKPKSFLRKPLVVQLAVEVFGPEITLVRISPPPTISRLRPPTDVSDAADIGLLKTSLAPSTRGIPHSVLKPPVVLVRAIFFGPQITLVPSRFGRPKSFLTPPAVVGAGIAFYGPQIWLTKIKPPKVIRAFIKALVVEQPFVPPRGHVCGFDIAGSFICFVELPGTKASGSDSAGSRVHGTTESSAKITGSDSAGGGVRGGDSAAE